MMYGYSYGKTLSYYQDLVIYLCSPRLVLAIAVQMLSTLNRNRISCKACLSAGRLSINDTDDNDDSEGTQ